MRISDYLMKQQWSRRELGREAVVSSVIGDGAGKAQMSKPSGRYITFNQDKFLNEINSGTHIVYDCNYRSNRPKYKYDTEKGKNVKDGYEEVTRIAVSWQEAIRGNKTSTCGGNPLWLGNENDSAEDAERMTKIKSHVNTMNLQAALLSHFYAIFGVADGALYFYRDGDTIKWQCFSYEDGNNCTMTRDREDPQKEMGVRYFTYEEWDAVELYRDENIELYIKFPDEETMRRYFPDAKGELTEDGYYHIRDNAHLIGESPFCYHRERDIPSGPGQKNIEYFETLLSDCGENIKYYAYQMLFLSGGAISLPNANFGGKVIGSKTSDGDAKILQPADASNTLDIGFKKVYYAICDSTKSVFIKPEDLKGQNDSGAYIANLYWPELQWATMFYARYHNCLIKILSVIKKLVGLIEGDIEGYSRVKISYMFEPYIPKNKLEQSTILQQGVTAGFISVETATEESDSANPQEYQRIKRELEEAARRDKAQQISNLEGNE